MWISRSQSPASDGCSPRAEPERAAGVAVRTTQRLAASAGPHRSRAVSALLDEHLWLGVDEVEPSAVRVLVVQSNVATRDALRGLLDDQQDFVVVDAVGAPARAMAIAGARWLDVALVDRRLGSASGLLLSSRLARMRPAPGVLVCSAFVGSALVAACVVAGARAAVVKTAPVAELLSVLRSVAAGELCLPVADAARSTRVRALLEPSELWLFDMMAAGQTRADLARETGLSPAHIESRLGAMLRKLDRLAAQPEGKPNARCAPRAH